MFQSLDHPNIVKYLSWFIDSKLNELFNKLDTDGDGELTKKLTVHAHFFSKTALAKIEAKGGKAEVIALPKKPVRNKMKPRPPKA